MNVNIFITDFDSSIAREKNKKIGACCNVTMPRDGSGPGSRNIQLLCGMQGNPPSEHKQSCCGMRSEVMPSLTSKATNQMVFHLFVAAKIKPKPSPVLARRALVLLARQSRVNHHPRSFFTFCPSKKAVPEVPRCISSSCLPRPHLVRTGLQTTKAEHLPSFCQARHSLLLQGIFVRCLERL